jgi:hypothetical protein
MVVEEYLPGRDCRPFGDYISVESVVAHGEISHVAVTGKLPLLSGFREQAQYWPVAPNVEQAAACELAGRALRALDVRTGLLHTEMKLTEDGPRVIEVNGRMGAWHNELALRAGNLDLVTVAGRVALGERVTVDTIRPSRVFYHLWHNAPTWDCVLEEVRGIRQLRTVPTVVGYRRVIHPGDRIDGALGTNFLGLVIGEAANHEEMLDAVEQAHDALEFVFSGPDGTRTLSGRDLAGEGQ